MPVPNHQLTTTLGLHHRIHAPPPNGWQLASNERAGTARETRGPAKPIGHAQGAARDGPSLLRVSCFPARLRAGLSLCHPCQDLGPAMRAVPATGGCHIRASDRGILSVISLWQCETKVGSPKPSELLAWPSL